MPLGRGTTLTLLRVCPSTFQLTEQAQKSCFQGASSLSKCSGQITKHQRKNNLSQCTSIFPFTLQEKLDQIFTWQSPQNRDVLWIFWVWAAVHQTFLWDHVSPQRVQPREISAFSCLQPVIYPVRVPTSDSLWARQVTILHKVSNPVGTNCFKIIRCPISASWTGFENFCATSVFCK